MDPDERWLLAAPRVPGPSEAWLRAHAEVVAPQVVLTATYEDPPRPWLPDVDHVAVQSIRSLGRYGLGRLLRSADMGALDRAASGQDVTAAIVHYANFFQLLDRRGLLLADRPVLVPVHGFDVTWSRLPACPVPYKTWGNTARYRQALVEASGRVLFVANSAFTRRRLIEAGFPADRVRVCYLPVPVEAEAQPGTSLSPEARPTASRPLQLLFVGRLVDFKGPVEVVDAVGLAIEWGGAVELTMVGDGPQRRLVEKVIRRRRLSDRVRLLGAKPHATVRELLRRCDAFVVHNKPDRRSGQEEAFGYAHAEALAAGKPVLSTRSGAPQEFLDDGGNSLLVGAGDIGAQAVAIAKLGDDRGLLRSLGAEARATASARFSPVAHRRRLEALVSSERGRR